MGQVLWRRELKRRLESCLEVKDGSRKKEQRFQPCVANTVGENSLRDCPGKSGEPGCAPAKQPIDLAWQRGIFAGELL